MKVQAFCRYRPAGYGFGFITVGQPACGRGLARASALTYEAGIGAAKMNVRHYRPTGGFWKAGTVPASNP